MHSNYDYLKFICERRKSIRKFSQKPVSPADIDNIKRIALTSPYTSGRQKWELTVISDKTKINKIADVVRNKVQELKGQIKEDYREEFMQYAVNFSAFETAPTLFIPTFRIAPALSVMITKGDNKIVEWERDTYVKSISCVAMLILLAAQSLELGGCYMTGPLIAEEKIGKVIKIRRGRNIGAIIPIGYPHGEES